LKVSTNVKIAMQCFETFGGQTPQMPPPWLRACYEVLGIHTESDILE